MFRIYLERSCLHFGQRLLFIVILTWDENTLLHSGLLHEAT